VPLQSKSLAFLIENSSNKNSTQLADNKQERPVLIENFEPNRARVFAPSHAPQIAPASDARRSFAAFLHGLPRAFFAKGLVCANTFLPGFAQHVEIDVTYSKQSTGEFLPGSRIARCASRTHSRNVHFVFRTVQRVPPLRAFSHSVCDAGRFAGAVSRNTGRGPRSTCLNALSRHLTNCRLNRLQLLPPAGVCTKERYSRLLSAPIRYSEASFVVE
jgi:hypothetical protein